MKSTLFTLFALAGSALALPQISTEPTGQPNPRDVQFDASKMIIFGDGCPTGSVKFAASTDKTKIQLIFEKFFALSGPGKGPEDWRKACTLSVPLVIPQGLSYSIVSSIYRGSGHLEKGQTGKCSTTYWFTGERGRQVRTSVSIPTGPKDEDYDFYWDKVDESDVVAWSPCGQTSSILNMMTDLNLLGNRNKPGRITIDAQDLASDTQYSQEIHIQWRNCPKNY
ncbi:hypothetical protein P152DRAFT_394676 [Eremomyces bilateralis CBS 781.70]|uniref:DUF4360 domain-containing protein n=1 Tax=Eremomyces bilateralis CBS 781.70 TaxID=1392243 RepID=A0A6G1G7B1_9PEZI|nr:uncharacterized protein P152DRAFT_394676 [Eremomyces bilateralis CBS 781.70]KAF1813914.1 hypothetical protein P152DRAFT_394676 [Eremomyces bilateralis CBS 781.70]